MIIKGGSRQNRRFFARHLTNTKDNDRVRIVEFRGFAHENVEDAFVDMEAVAKGTGCKNFFYHASLSPREDEHLTDAQWSRAEDTLERNLGLAGQPRIVFEHEKDGRTHRHVVWSRIDLGSMTAISDSLTYREHEKAAREIEGEMSLQPVASVLVKDRETPRPERRARDWEGFRGSKSGIDPDRVKAEVTALWNSAGSGADFRAGLAERGYLLCKGDRRDFCIIDPAGDDHSLARRIDGVKAGEVRKSMQDIDREALPTVAEGRSERRSDGRHVQDATAAGANPDKVAATINASRAADAIEAPPHDGDGERRGVEERTVIAQRKTAKDQPADSSWRKKEENRRQREKDSSLER